MEMIFEVTLPTGFPPWRWSILEEEDIVDAVRVSLWSMSPDESIVIKRVS